MTDAFEWVPRDTEYAEAQRVLDAYPYRESALIAAHMRLAREGGLRPQYRDLIVRAAEIIREQPETTTPEST